MWDLETMQKMNAPKTHGKVSSDGRVCTDYYSRPTRKRFYVQYDEGGLRAHTCDSITMQGYGDFGPMPNEDADRLCDLLNTLTIV